MDTKKQEKLKEEVWRFVMNDSGKPSRIESFIGLFEFKEQCSTWGQEPCVYDILLM